MRGVLRFVAGFVLLSIALFHVDTAAVRATSSQAAFGGKVLVVASGDFLPQSGRESTYVLTDLVAAGIPFDLTNYQKFLTRDLRLYDVVIFVGPTTPTPVNKVAEAAAEAVASGIKLIVLGSQPTKRYDGDRVVQEVDYRPSILGIAQLLGRRVDISTHPRASVDVLRDDTALRTDLHLTFLGGLSSSAQYCPVTLGGVAIACFTEHGALLGGEIGAIDDANYLLALYDYGKVVNYVRHRDTRVVGFANDRQEGRPVVSLLVHGDMSRSSSATSNISAIAARFQIPIDATIVSSRLSWDSTVGWNRELQANRFLALGSHSRSHPGDWPGQSVKDQVIYALGEQQRQIPMTKRFFDWSGNMNPTAAQIDEVWRAGIVFEGGGTSRRYAVFDNRQYDLGPTCYTPGWVQQLAASETEPPLVGHFAESDWAFYVRKQSYVTGLMQEYEEAHRLGLPFTTWVHDYIFDSTEGKKFSYGQGLYSEQFQSAIEHLIQDRAVFLSYRDAVSRLSGFRLSRLLYDTDVSGNIVITVQRATFAPTEIKVEAAEGETLKASGPNIVSQHQIGSFLYVTIEPGETTQVTINVTHRS